MAEGTVTYYDDEGGYGFIETDDTDDDDDVFFHITDVDGYDELAEGDELKFNVGVGDKGPRAEDLEVVGDE